MKNIIYKIFLLPALMLFATNTAKAQLPLAYGDAVATHSPIQNSGVVLRTVKTSNTSTATTGGNWNTPAMTPAGTKPSNWSAPGWTVQKLGSIFGVTIDDKTSAPNIYVSSTQIYGGSVLNQSKIFRIDGTSGIPTQIFDFLNKDRSLGNLKYLRIGTVENIYVSNWDGTGSINRIKSINNGVTWTAANTFVAKDSGGPLKNTMPYGIAIRKLSGTGNPYRLYYSRISLQQPYSANDIWSVELDVNGDFDTATEQAETLNISLMAGASTASFPYNNGIAVISDMAFSESKNSLLIGQQTWQNSNPATSQFAVMGAHNSKVVEFDNQLPLGSHSWNVNTNLYPAGGGVNKNCAGGVSYSSNIMMKDDLSFACDTTIWLSTDVMSAPNPLVYGIQGMRRSPANTLWNSIWIDADDNTTTWDKTRLGDVEVYKKPLSCNPCSCGNWQGGPTLGGSPIPAVGGTAGTVLTYPIQFIQGNVSGLLNAIYNCTGNCNASYSWQIVAASGVPVATGTSLPLDLKQYNSKLSCGVYRLVINVKCGDSDCGRLIIPITIICEPPSCCSAEITIKQTAASFNVVTNLANPNAFSIGSGTFSISTTTPMTEVRVSVEEFRLIASSPNCLNCNNRPVTWGNILSASLNAQPMNLSGYIGPVTGSIAADYREAVLNSTVPIALNPGSLNIRLSLPTVTELSCCEVKVYLCLKFTFKDINCKECVQMVCGEFALNPGKSTGTVTATPIGPAHIKTFKVEH